MRCANLTAFPIARSASCLIVTDTADIPKLEALYKQSQINGVEGMKALDAADAMRMEPRPVLRRGVSFRGNRYHRQPSLHAGVAR